MFFMFQNTVLAIQINTNLKITQEDKTNLISNIEKYEDTHELVFAIIRCYQINNSNDISCIPFYGKYLKTKQSYKFDVNYVPDKLINMLKEFYKLHINSLKK